MDSETARALAELTKRVEKLEKSSKPKEVKKEEKNNE